MAPGARAKRSKSPAVQERPTAAPVAPKLSIFVSSAVHGYEDLLESIYALLDGFGYHVLMSHKGTIPIDASRSAMDNCLDAVDRSDLFLGLILPRYGSGKEEADGQSITHREALRAIELNKPRWFLVHEHVSIARQLLGPLLETNGESRLVLKGGLEHKPSAVLQDLRVLELYDSAIQNHVPDVAARRGNWVQPFGPDEDAKLFVTAQFRRHRELAEKHLPKLRDVDAVRARAKRGSK